jgi:hypothetical protein
VCSPSPQDGYPAPPRASGRKGCRPGLPAPKDGSEARWAAWGPMAHRAVIVFQLSHVTGLPAQSSAFHTWNTGKHHPRSPGPARAWPCNWDTRFQSSLIDWSSPQQPLLPGTGPDVIRSRRTKVYSFHDLGILFTQPLISLSRIVTKFFTLTCHCFLSPKFAALRWISPSRLLSLCDRVAARAAIACSDCNRSKLPCDLGPQTRSPDTRKNRPAFLFFDLPVLRFPLFLCAKMLI